MGDGPDLDPHGIAGVGIMLDGEMIEGMETVVIKPRDMTRYRFTSHNLHSVMAPHQKIGYQTRRTAGGDPEVMMQLKVRCGVWSGG